MDPGLIHMLTLEFSKTGLEVSNNCADGVSAFLSQSYLAVTPLHFVRLYVLGWFLFRFLSLCLKELTYNFFFFCVSSLVG